MNKVTEQHLIDLGYVRSEYHGDRFNVWIREVSSFGRGDRKSYLAVQLKSDYPAKCFIHCTDNTNDKVIDSYFFAKDLTHDRFMEIHNAICKYETVSVSFPNIYVDKINFHNSEIERLKKEIADHEKEISFYEKPLIHND